MLTEGSDSWGPPDSADSDSRFELVFKPHRWVAVVLVAISDPSDPDAAGLPTFDPFEVSEVKCFDCGISYSEELDGSEATRCASPRRPGFPSR